MRNGADNQTGSLASLVRKTLTTGLGALDNRAELFMVEAQEDKSRIVGLIVTGVAALFLGMMTLLLLTGTIIFLIPEDYRLYAAIGFTVLYLAGTIAAVLGLKSMLKRVPFSESLNQIRKDRELLDAFK